MKITVITLFPEMLDGFLNASILKRAQEKSAAQIECVQLREYAVDIYGTIDDRPFGGAAGMVLMAEPVIKAVKKVKTSSSKVILTSARGSLFTQEKAKELATHEHLIIVAGHYEAVDERVMDEIDEELSIGDYILTGGELPAGVIIDAIVRLLPGVLKKEQATHDESFSHVSLEELKKAIGGDPILHALDKKGITQVKLLEYPHYTRPQNLEGKDVPDILLSGHHAEIRKWQLQQAFSITKKRRPDLLS
ncbi:tRNA (guanosine(37)-N1)-methyltransferase TrmD [Candidatus Roizmanbacteria bacterium RIFCSPHIGHO2_02_FULL_43_11]|uniref:tRNA (guanine-N(1)-)-methyltransferase n=1 Tax=Candidatus Roizmanbacteria bacterium RIFCSPHIGHO2_02_FULL_43_11 TaxID=1802043 RepID=A0A1F7HH76_9BACT|nr:MAG: tRNA (guanosine(37)-N1)-methyltransferase TrmD [Candidatus Roizmanbacteria bacterium RIFCSPHIGHO2_02_FULL_43_11]